MPSCSATNCRSRHVKGARFPRFFRWPTAPDRARIWMERCRLADSGWRPKPSSRLCEKHFDSTQFEEHRQDGWKKLKPNAVPTLFVSEANVCTLTAETPGRLTIGGQCWSRVKCGVFVVDVRSSHKYSERQHTIWHAGQHRIMQRNNYLGFIPLGLGILPFGRSAYLHICLWPPVCCCHWYVGPFNLPKDGERWWKAAKVGRKMAKVILVNRNAHIMCWAVHTLPYSLYTHLAYIRRTTWHCISLVARTLHCHFITFDWKFMRASRLTELAQ